MSIEQQDLVANQVESLEDNDLKQEEESPMLINRINPMEQPSQQHPSLVMGPSAASNPASSSPFVSPPLKPLTNHEIYELNQQQQNKTGNIIALHSSGSIKRSLTSSPTTMTMPNNSIVVANKKRAPIERQESLIVGTPSFREKYGKLS